MKRILLPTLVIGVLLLGACGSPSTAPSTEAPLTSPPTEEPAPPTPPEEEEPSTTPAEAVTEVGGIISSNTKWAKENSPYVLTSTIQIPEGVTLTIEPGVTISKPSEGDMFLLLGTIHAHGNAQEPIVFDGGGNSTIISTDPGHGIGDFEYCVFKNGYRLWDRWGTPRQLGMLDRYRKIPTEVSDMAILNAHPRVKLWQEIIPYLLEFNPYYRRLSNIDILT